MVTGQGKANGTLVVTSHRVLFVCENHSTSLFLQDCVGVGDITGKMPSKMSLTSEGKEISIQLADRRCLTALQAAVLSAIVDYPNHASIDFPADKK